VWKFHNSYARIHKIVNFFVCEFKPFDARKGGYLNGISLSLVAWDVSFDTFTSCRLDIEDLESSSQWEQTLFSS
jgi:hypothetical protein